MSNLKSSLHSQVAHILAQQIFRGDLRPGDSIPPAETLAAHFGVSRTVLREAIKLLTAKGLIEARPRTGMSVRPRSAWSLLDADVLAWRAEAGFDREFLDELIGLRRIIEPGAAELAAQTATSAEIMILHKLYDHLASALGDAEKFTAADVAFHQAIVSACHNELLTQMGKTIGVTIATICQVTTRLQGSSELSLKSHRAVVEAIEQHDTAEARETMRFVVDEAASEINRYLQTGGQMADIHPKTALWQTGVLWRSNGFSSQPSDSPDENEQTHDTT